MAPSSTTPMRTQYGKGITSPGSGLKFELPSFSFGSESIVAGTNIPAPEREPSPQPQRSQPQVNTATKQGSDTMDPLRSHPTTPSASTPIGGASSKQLGHDSNGNTAEPTSSDMSPPLKRPHHVRKLLSLRSLSNSFSSHARSDSAMSGMSGVSNGGSDFAPRSGVSRSQTPSLFGRTSTGTYDRPGTSSGRSVADSTATSRPSLRKRVSGAFWSSRRNSMMLNNIEEANAEVGHTPGGDGKENRALNSGSQSPVAKRVKQGPPPPTLPEIGELRVSKGLKDAGAESGGFLNAKELFGKVKYKREVSAEEVAAMKKQRLEA